MAEQFEQFDELPDTELELSQTTNPRVYDKVQEIVAKQKLAGNKNPSCLTKYVIEHPQDKDLRDDIPPDPHAFAAAGTEIYVFQPQRWCESARRAWQAGTAAKHRRHDHKCLHKGEGKPPCPACGCNCRVTCEGVNDRARRVVGMDRDHLLLGETFRCNKCPEARDKDGNLTGGDRTFQSTDPKVVATLPLDIQARLPAQLTHRAGVTQAVVDMVDVQAMQGHSFSSICSHLQELHIRKDIHLQLQYHAAYARYEAGVRVQPTLRTLFSASSPPAKRPAWPGRLFKRLPQSNYLEKIYLEYPLGRRRRRRFTAFMASTKATVVKGDICHKVAKMVRTADGQEVSMGALLFTNQRRMPIGWWEVSSTSPRHWMEPLLDVFKRNRDPDTGECTIKSMYIDNLESLYRVLGNILAGREVADDDPITDDLVKAVVDALPDVKLRQDIWHFLRRYGDATAGPKNGLYQEFINRLTDAILLYAVEDCREVLKALAGAPVYKIISALRKKCRRYIIDGATTYAAITAVMELFRGRTDAAGNALLTEETWKVHRNQKRLVVDLQGLADPLPLEEMYFKDASGRWCTIRGTSHVESINRPFNHHLSGPNTSAAVAQALYTDFFGALGLRTAVLNGDAVDYGTDDVGLLLEVNSLNKAAGLAEPYDKLPHADWDMQGVAFGHEWQRPLLKVEQLTKLRSLPDVDDDTGEALDASYAERLAAQVQSCRGSVPVPPAGQVGPLAAILSSCSAAAAPGQPSSTTNIPAAPSPLPPQQPSPPAMAPNQPNSHAPAAPTSMPPSRNPQHLPAASSAGPPHPHDPRLATTQPPPHTAAAHTPMPLPITPHHPPAGSNAAPPPLLYGPSPPHQHTHTPATCMPPPHSLTPQHPSWASSAAAIRPQGLILNTHQPPAHAAATRTPQPPLPNPQHSLAGFSMPPSHPQDPPVAPHQAGSHNPATSSTLLAFRNHSRQATFSAPACPPEASPLMVHQPPAITPALASTPLLTAPAGSSMPMPPAAIPPLCNLSVMAARLKGTRDAAGTMQRVLQQCIIPTCPEPQLSPEEEHWQQDLRQQLLQPAITRAKRNELVALAIQAARKSPCSAAYKQVLNDLRVWAQALPEAPSSSGSAATSSAGQEVTAMPDTEQQVHTAAPSPPVRPGPLPPPQLPAELKDGVRLHPIFAEHSAKAAARATAAAAAAAAAGASAASASASANTSTHLPPPPQQEQQEQQRGSKRPAAAVDDGGPAQPVAAPAAPASTAAASGPRPRGRQAGTKFDGGYGCKTCRELVEKVSDGADLPPVQQQMHHHSYTHCKVVRPLSAKIQQLEKELKGEQPAAQPAVLQSSLATSKELLQRIGLHIRRGGTAVLVHEHLPEDLQAALLAAGIQPPPEPKPQQKKLKKQS